VGAQKVCTAKIKVRRSTGIYQTSRAAQQGGYTIDDY
jgi:hypothetical protein